jgi:hypothetical protein
MGTMGRTDQWMKEGRSMSQRLLKMGILAAGALLLWGTAGESGSRHFGGLQRMGTDSDGGLSINIIVREIKVTPIYAHVGDVIQIEMVTEDRDELAYNTTNAEIYANGKIVARKRVTYGYGGEGARIQRETFLWNTRGHKPGEYHIKGEVFVFYDSSPFDNSLEVGQPLVLLPEGAAFPPGVKEGGIAIARDPRYKPAPRSPQDGSGVEGSGGY